MQIDKENIPTRSMNIRKSTYPRLTEREEEVVARRKLADQGTEQEAEKVRECNYILMEEHYDFVCKIHMRLLEAQTSFTKCNS